MNIKRMILTAAFLAGGTLYAGVTASLQAQSPMTTGIKVNGDWTIEVRNPGGKIVTRGTFSNHLETTGSSALSAILTRGETPESWFLKLYGPGCSGVSDCFFAEGTEGDGNLTVTHSSGSIVMSGVHTATAAGDVGAVATFLQTRNLGGIFPTRRFTYVTLPVTLPGTLPGPPIAVSAGQIIQVKVVISFS